ncbi:MAG TPA: glycosyltransferase [Gaiellaceae bacterium]|nr:glycosyltransferase [Gaiellaceae bacterium]
MADPRLLYLASSFPYGRNDGFFAPEFRELVRQGVDVLAVPIRPRGRLTTTDAEPRAQRKRLLDAEIAWAALTETVRAPLAVGRALLLLLHEPRPQVLLRNLAAFPKALWIARIARTWPASHIHAHWAGPPATAALVASRLSGVPWSFTAHFADIAANNLLCEKSESATFVRFIATAMMELAGRTAPDCDQSTWHLLHLGVDVPPRRVPLASLNRPPVLLMAARFDPEKRHETLVEATHELVGQGFELEVWLAGAGALEATVAQHVRARDLEHCVRFLGFVPNRQVLEWLASGRVDLVVLPSDAEGIPVSLIEALAHSVPVVGCDAGGVTELLGDGCGEIVPPRDPHALAEAIARVLRSPELRARRARAGRERIEAEFAIEPIVRRLRVLLDLADAK